MRIAVNRFGMVTKGAEFHHRVPPPPLSRTSVTRRPAGPIRFPEPAKKSGIVPHAAIREGVRTFGSELK